MIGVDPKEHGQNVYVRPFFRVVANGVAATRIDSGLTRVKCVLVATPEPADDGGGFLLSDWPSAMAGLLSQGGKFANDATQAKPAAHKMRLWLEVFDPAMGGTFPTPGSGRKVSIEANVVGHRRVGSPNAWLPVTQLWRQSIAGSMIVTNATGARRLPDDPWKLLLEDIRQSLTADKHTADPQRTYSGSTNIPDTTGRFDNDGAIVARRPAADDKILVQGLLSIRQGAMALDEERVRASRVLAKIARGPYLPGDGDHIDGEPLPGPETLQETTTTVLPSDDEFKTKRRQKLFDRLSKAINDTNTDRRSTSETFNKVRDYIKGQTPLSPEVVEALRHRSAGLPPLAPADEVLTGDNREREGRRASQTYGAWLQRSTESNRQTSYQAHPSAYLSAEAATAFEHVRAVYYSLQGDALLSRLFCFAVDLEFDLDGASIDLSKPAYMFLSADAAGDKSFTPQILTTAKFDSQTKQFWPVSRFEMGLDPTHCLSRTPLEVCNAASGTIEQHDGIWNLGAGHSDLKSGIHDPRYDLISLDVRRAVDFESERD